MNTTNMQKSQSWHPADIIAALCKRCTSLSAVPREAGLASTMLPNALTRPQRYYDQSGKRVSRESLIRHRASGKG